MTCRGVRRAWRGGGAESKAGASDASYDRGWCGCGGDEEDGPDPLFRDYKVWRTRILLILILVNGAWASVCISYGTV